MTEPLRSRTGQLMARVNSVSDLPATLDALAVSRGRPVLVLVGGAGRMSHEDVRRAAEALARQVVPVMDRLGAVVVDGGTDSGVMRVMGEARSAAGANFPLVGVAAEGTVSAHPAATGTKAAEIEPRHSHVILVPGDSWGDESPWLANVADAVAGTGPSATLVVNGGEITYHDIARSLERRRPVIVLAGTGRTADAIATATDHDGEDLHARQIASSPLTRIVSIDDGPALARTLESILGRSPRRLRGRLIAVPIGDDPDALRDALQCPGPGRGRLRWKTQTVNKVLSSPAKTPVKSELTGVLAGHSGRLRWRPPMRLISYQSHDAWPDWPALGGGCRASCISAREGGPARTGGVIDGGPCCQPGAGSQRAASGTGRRPDPDL